MRTKQCNLMPDINIRIPRTLLLVMLSLVIVGCGVNKEKVKKDRTSQTKDLFLHYTDYPANTLVEQYQIIGKPFRIAQIGNNASGITWDPYLQQYLIIQNNTAVIYRFDSEFNFLGKIKKAGKIHNDTEGISFVDGKYILVATEANMIHSVPINQAVFERGYFTANLNFRLADRPTVKNKGIESVAYRVANKTRSARYYAAIEGTARESESRMRVFYVEADSKPGFLGDTLSYNNNITVIEPFDAETAFAGVITDIAGMTFDPFGKTLIIVSQESKKVIQVDPETGQVLSQLKLSGAPVYEGVTIGPAGELVLVSERNWVQVYRKHKIN